MKTFTISICKKCFDLEPGVCNNPDCQCIRMQQGDRESFLDSLNIRPIIKGIHIDMGKYEDIGE